jgi:hypothetical protein
MRCLFLDFHVFQKEVKNEPNTFFLILCSIILQVFDIHAEKKIEVNKDE